MQSGFSIHITGTCAAGPFGFFEPSVTPARPACGAVAATVPRLPDGGWVPLTRQCHGVRLLVWEAMVLAGRPMADARSRRRLAAHVRQIAMYVCHVALCVPMSDIAQACGRDRSTVSHACHVTEDRRDDPTFDAFIACIERMALAAFGRMEGYAHG